MPLTAGTRIGPYEIVSAIGEGGMGEVYRARDSRLARDVAVKVLPTALSDDPDRLARFDREAKTLAALNHPHIAQIYGLEQSASTRALILELVEGETLADRLAHGPIPITEALAIARQIGDGLEAAHEHGIVHRDLKPANIKVTPAGVIKVLDFGLAKLSSDGTATTLSGMQTITSPALMTNAGLILGTAAYMSPEQARGKAVDKRCDIWAFGVVLYEMITGRRAFAGDSVTEVAAAVIHLDPDWSALPANVPATARLVLRRCLQKDPKQRLQDIGDARLALDGVFDTGSATEIVHTRAPVWRRALPWMVTAIVAAAWAIVAWRAPSPPPTTPVRFVVSLGARALMGSILPFALSPDGMSFAIAEVGDAKRPRLAVRRLDQKDARTLAGTEDAGEPFFSPDSKWVAFVRHGKIWKVSLEGGSPAPVCDVANARGASWGPDGFIVVATDRLGGLSRCPVAGGTAESITKLDPATSEISHRWPQALAGVVIFAATKTANTPDDNTIYAQSLTTGQRKLLWKGGTSPRYVPSGHLLFVARNTLYAATMDLSRLELTGSPIPVMDDVITVTGSDWAVMDVSASGALVFAPQEPSGRLAVQQLVAGTRDVRPMLPGVGRFEGFTFSPDWARAAVLLTQAPTSDMWIYDTARGQRSRVTSTPFISSTQPRWSPSGRHVIFVDRTSRRDGLAAARADGSGELVRLIDGRGPLTSFSLSPDGRSIAFAETVTGEDRSPSDIWLLPVDFSGADPRATGNPEPLLKTQFNERGPVFSPDGRWLAYESDESGEQEIYVRAFPGPGTKVQASVMQGRHAIWSPSAKDLFYQSPSGRIMRVAYTVSGGTLTTSAPQPASELEVSGDLMDVSRDGKNFVFIGPAGGEKIGVEVTFVMNFLDELRRRVAVGK
jgi:Tol biopolymer transport system component